eukprot:1150667-Pelagomonas_calceolata.AAC.2
MSVPIRAGLPAPGQQGRPAVFGCGKGQWQGCRWRGQEHDEHRGAAGAVSVAPRHCSKGHDEHRGAAGAIPAASIGTCYGQGHEGRAKNIMSTEETQDLNTMSTEETQDLFLLHPSILWARAYVCVCWKEHDEHRGTAGQFQQHPGMRRGAQKVFGKGAEGACALREGTHCPGIQHAEAHMPNFCDTQATDFKREKKEKRRVERGKREGREEKREGRRSFRAMLGLQGTLSHTYEVVQRESGGKQGKKSKSSSAKHGGSDSEGGSSSAEEAEESDAGDSESDEEQEKEGDQGGPGAAGHEGQEQQQQQQQHVYREQVRNPCAGVAAVMILSLVLKVCTPCFSELPFVYWLPASRGSWVQDPGHKLCLERGASPVHVLQYIALQTLALRTLSCGLRVSTHRGSRSANSLMPHSSCSHVSW